jgi:hypothetical protein
MATELLITQIGIAFNRLCLNDIPPKYWKAYEIIKDKASMEIKELKNDFFIRFNFDLFSSSSSAPSNTISINPNVPNMGRRPDRSGILKEIKSAICLAVHPRINKSITDGILVRAEVRSKRYPSKSRMQMIMITVMVIRIYTDKKYICNRCSFVHFGYLQYKRIFSAKRILKMFFPVSPKKKMRVICSFTD